MEGKGGSAGRRETEAGHLPCALVRQPWDGARQPLSSTELCSLWTAKGGHGVDELGCASPISSEAQPSQTQDRQGSLPFRFPSSVCPILGSDSGDILVPLFILAVMSSGFFFKPSLASRPCRFSRDGCCLPSLGNVLLLLDRMPGNLWCHHSNRAVQEKRCHLLSGACCWLCLPCCVASDVRGAEDVKQHPLTKAQ